MDGKQINVISDCDWEVTAKRSGTAPFAEAAVLELRFYHRTAVGGLTLITTDWTGELTASYAVYTGTVNFTQFFDTDEGLRAGYYIWNKGVPP